MRKNELLDLSDLTSMLIMKYYIHCGMFDFATVPSSSRLFQHDKNVRIGVMGKET